MMISTPGTTPSDGPLVPPDALRVQQRELEEHLEVALFRTDADGRWIALSYAWTRMTGYPVSTCLGLSARQFVHESDQVRYSALAQNLLKSPGQFFRQTLRIRRQDGQSGWMHVYAARRAEGDTFVTSGYLADASAPASQYVRRRPMRVVQDGHTGALDRLNVTAPMATDPPQQPLNILLIEDQPVTQKLMRLVIEKWGHHVHVASDGQAGLESFLQTPFDVVLMDLQLPVMDGLSVTTAIRIYESQNRIAHTPIVALTAQNTPDDRDICFAAGMDNYLAKPVRATSLRETLQAYASQPVRRGVI